jgi:hypothetical protein
LPQTTERGAPGVRIVVARSLLSERLSGHHRRGSRWTVICRSNTVRRLRVGCFVG